MPTYEYECRRCGHLFERFQSIKAEPVKRCPQCKGKVERLIGTGAGVIFKGSGFYTTDYRSESYKKAANAAKQESTPSGGDSGKTDKTAATRKVEPAKTKTDSSTASGKT